MHYFGKRDQLARPGSISANYLIVELQVPHDMHLVNGKVFKFRIKGVSSDDVSYVRHNKGFHKILRLI